MPAMSDFLGTRSEGVKLIDEILRDDDYDDMMVGTKKHQKNVNFILVFFHTTLKKMNFGLRWYWR